MLPLHWTLQCAWDHSILLKVLDLNQHAAFEKTKVGVSLVSFTTQAYLPLCLQDGRLALHCALQGEQNESRRIRLFN